jgi:hypothetical protein
MVPSLIRRWTVFVLTLSAAATSPMVIRTGSGHSSDSCVQTRTGMTSGCGFSPSEINKNQDRFLIDMKSAKHLPSAMH